MNSVVDASVIIAAFTEGNTIALNYILNSQSALFLIPLTKIEVANALKQNCSFYTLDSKYYEKARGLGAITLLQ